MLRGQVTQYTQSTATLIQGLSAGLVSVNKKYIAHPVVNPIIPRPRRQFPIVRDNHFVPDIHSQTIHHFALMQRLGSLDTRVIVETLPVIILIKKIQAGNPAIGFGEQRMVIDILQ